MFDAADDLGVQRLAGACDHAAGPLGSFDHVVDGFTFVVCEHAFCFGEQDLGCAEVPETDPIGIQEPQVCFADCDAAALESSASALVHDQDTKRFVSASNKIEHTRARHERSHGLDRERVAAGQGVSALARDTPCAPASCCAEDLTCGWSCHDPHDRSSILDQGDHDHVLAVPLDELASAVEWVHHPEAIWSLDTVAVRCFLVQDERTRIFVEDDVADDTGRSPVCHGHRCVIILGLRLHTTIEFQSCFLDGLRCLRCCPDGRNQIRSEFHCIYLLLPRKQKRIGYFAYSVKGLLLFCMPFYPPSLDKW